VREREARRARAPAQAPGDEDQGSESEAPEDEEPSEPEGEEDGADVPAGKGMSVEQFLGGGFRDGMESESEASAGGDDMMEEMEDMPEDESAHVQDLEKLKEKDPEFYKYLQENDRDLLAFGQGGGDLGEVPEEGEEDEEPSVQVVTMELLGRWQKSLLQHRSLRALRRLLLAFRSAVHTGGDEEESGQWGYRVDDGAVFSKLLITTFKYMPMVMEHHVPYRRGADGRFKVPTSSKKWSTLVRPLRSYFMSVLHLLRTLPEPDMVYVALTESAKMVPYLQHDRRVTRDYVRVLLTIWSSAADHVRLAAFSCLRLATASAMDEEMVDFCLRSTYHTLLRSSRLTTPYTLPSIQLMKNTACELFMLHMEASYQQAFGFIRQLAISLRSSLKNKSKESYQAVLNWPYVHCLDFWSLVLSRGCDVEAEAAAGGIGASALRPLVYPLVQVALGAARLVPISRYYPLRLHVLRALLRLMQHTGVYVPLAPAVTEVFESAEFQRRAKGATLKPLDLDTTLRAPAAYVRTRVYADQLAEEYAFVLLEFLATQAKSIALPELAIPITVQLRRTLKASSNPRLAEALRPLLDRLQQNAAWVSQRRQGVEFAPGDHAQVDAFLAQDTSEAPLQSALRLARKVRAQKRRLLEQNAHVVGEDEE